MPPERSSFELARQKLYGSMHVRLLRTNFNPFMHLQSNDGVRRLHTWVFATTTLRYLDSRRPPWREAVPHAPSSPYTFPNHCQNSCRHKRRRRYSTDGQGDSPQNVQPASQEPVMRKRRVPRLRGGVHGSGPNHYPLQRSGNVRPARSRTVTAAGICGFEPILLQFR